MHNLISKLVLKFSDNKVVAFLEPSKKNQIKSLLYSGFTSKYIMCGGAHLRGLAPGQPSGQQSINKRRSDGDLLATLSVYDLTCLEVEQLPPTRKAMSLLLYQPAGY